MTTLSGLINKSRVEAEHLRKHGKHYIASLLTDMADGAERLLGGEDDVRPMRRVGITASDDRVRDAMMVVGFAQETQNTMMTTEGIVRTVLNIDWEEDPDSGGPDGEVLTLAATARRWIGNCVDPMKVGVGKRLEVMRYLESLDPEPYITPVIVAYRCRRRLFGTKEWFRRGEITTSDSTSIHWEGEGVPPDIRAGDYLNGLPWFGSLADHGSGS